MARKKMQMAATSPSPVFDRLALQAQMINEMLDFDGSVEAIALKTKALEPLCAQVSKDGAPVSIIHVSKNGQFSVKVFADRVVIE